MDWTGEPKEVKMDLSNKRITVTGGKGFLGTHLIRKLKEERKCQNVFIADLPEYDLRVLEDIKRMYEEQRPEIVIHLAALVGGIGTNRENPGKYFYENAIMGIQLIHEEYLRVIEKFVALGTYAVIPNTRPYLLRRRTYGMAILRKQMHPMGWLKRCC